VSATLLRNARVAGSDAPRDLLVADGRLVLGSGDGVPADVVDLEGRFVGPGLWDAHVHVGQWALRGARLDVSAADSAAAAAALVRRHLEANPQPADAVLVGQGFRDGLWPDEPTAELLDAVGAPVALVSGDVHTVWSNAAALRIMGLPASDWWLREQPAFDLNVRLSEVPAHTLDRWVLDAAERAAARGVVGIRDFEFDDAVGAWLRRFGTGFRGLRVDALIYPPHLGSAVAAGYRTGAELAGLLTVGRLKLFTDGSLNTRTAWCDDDYPGLHGSEAAGVPTYGPGELLAAARAGVDAGIVPTIHAIGDRATAEALDAFEALALPAGSPRGSIQHAQLVREADLPRFARLGVVASVQPEHAMDDRDVADHYWAGRTGRSFALRSLLDAGAELELGSDAPVAPLDPWVTISAAVTRRRDGRDPWHPEQAITVDEALRASQGGVAGLADGGRADLVVTDEDPRTIDLERLRTMPVHATMVAGEWTYRGD
jgi:predicted amidohydrolase YtcJ